MFDGIDDGIEVKDNSDYSKGITLEIYFTLKGQNVVTTAEILMMKRTYTGNGFFLFISNKAGSTEWYQDKRIIIDIGGSYHRFITSYEVQENVPTYITYTYNPYKENEKGILYVNGVKTETTDLGNIDNLINTPENTPIQIGSDIYETYKEEGTINRKYPFYGEIYASRVYNRALTESEVKYNYEMTVNNSN